MLAERLFSLNPNKIREMAKGKTYEQFIAHLQGLPNAKIVFEMSENDKKLLYILATSQK